MTSNDDLDDAHAANELDDARAQHHRAYGARRLTAEIHDRDQHWNHKKRRDEAALARRADACDRRAARELTELLDRRDDVDGLAQRADAGDRHAAERLADLLVERPEAGPHERRTGS